MNHDDIPTRTTNLALSTTHIDWPDGNTSCLFVAFDFDAETAWFDDDADDVELLVRMSHGGFGPRVGVPRILELLADLDIGATFFTPGWVVDTYPALCTRILEAGHELGHHGYHHLRPGVGEGSGPGSLSRSVAEIDSGFDAFERRLDYVPVGYRAPSGENHDELLAHLKDRGITYSSSWRDDILPYRHVLRSGKPGPIELPANSSFDDWNHGVMRGSSRNMLTREQVLSIWRDELEQTHAWRGLTTTVFHPQVSGRPSRFMILAEFLTHAREHDDLWIAAGEDIARQVATQL